MGINIRFERPGYELMTDLCTNHGYHLLCEWFEARGKKYPALKALADDGTYPNTEELANQMDEAFEKSPPRNKDVRHTADRMLHLLGCGKPDESVKIEC